MTHLIQLTFANEEVFLCTSLEHAKSKAIASMDDGITVDMIPEGGGPMMTLVFDQSVQDWIPE